MPWIREVVGSSPAPGDFSHYIQSNSKHRETRQKQMEVPPDKLLDCARMAAILIEDYLNKRKLSDCNELTSIEGGFDP